jgi:thiazolinyl imide reductase
MRRLNTVVCGTRFGENYISALLEEDTVFRLAGILARGSERSRTLAADVGVRLFTRSEDLPGDIDVACVVLRSGAFGGPGTQVAEALLRRGIHVVQEHPVHPHEIRQLLAAARGSGARYQVNGFYAHSPAGRNFIRFVSEWRKVRMPHYAVVTTSPQLLYSSLDLLGRAFGGLEDFEIGAKAAWPSDILAATGREAPPPFEVLQGRIGPAPLILNCQGWLDPRDPDHHALVMHNIAVGGPEGRIELAGSFGPLVWSRAIYVPDYEHDAASASYLRDWSASAQQPHMALPTAMTLGAPDGPSLAEAGRKLFPEIVLAALAELRAAIEAEGSSPDAQQEGYLVALGTAWQRVMQRLGPLIERSIEPPSMPLPDPRNFMPER